MEAKVGSSSKKCLLIRLGMEEGLIMLSCGENVY